MVWGSRLWNQLAQQGNSLGREQVLRAVALRLPEHETERLGGEGKPLGFQVRSPQVQVRHAGRSFGLSGWFK